MLIFFNLYMLKIEHYLKNNFIKILKKVEVKLYY